jgi:serine/threonine protein kinase
LRLFYDVALAVQYLHGQGDAHGDIKPENSAIDCSGRAKLIDFGWATQCTFVVDNAKRGTLTYAAPELLQRGKYHTQKAGCWALEILLYVMATWKFPFNQNDEIERLIRKMTKVNLNE